MTVVKICDITLCALAKQQGAGMSFKETLEAAKLIEKSGADIIQLPTVSEEQKDAVTARSIASTLQKAALAIEVGMDKAALDRALAIAALAKAPRVNLLVPVSAVQMEYSCKIKPEKLLVLLEELLAKCVDAGVEIEITLDDATRGEMDFCATVIELAKKYAVSTVTVSDNAGILLPDEAEAFIQRICGFIGDADITCGFAAKNTLGVASANAAFAVKGGAGELKLAFNGMGVEGLSIEQFAQLIRTKGDALQLSCALNMAELQRISKRLESIIGMNRNMPSPFSHVMEAAKNEDDVDGSELGADVDILTLRHRIESLGYDLTEEELQKVYIEFQILAAKKSVKNKDIEALVADMARQIPPTYKLINYIINSGSGITATAYVSLDKMGEVLKGVSMGDGPIDASFMAIEQILGHHYELEEFHIQAVTEGREAMGDAFIKLRYNGKLYAGRGLDTDILGSCVRAYINAVNKIIYEEKQ